MKNNFEWGFQEIKFKPLNNTEVTMEHIIKGVIPIMLIVILATAVVWKSFIIVVAGIVFILVFCAVIFLLTCIDRVKDDVLQDLKNRRTECIQAKVVKIECEPEADYDYVRIICRYVSEKGVMKKFSTRKVIGYAICKEGDYVDVFIDPNNFDNYEIDITKCIK